MKRPCLTLIELLVVIAIITFLIAMLLPSLHSIRQQAKAVICGLNIRNLLHTGLLNYENENETLPYSFYKKPFQNPPPGGYPGHPVLDKPGWWWFNFIGEYYRKRGTVDTIVKCPSKKLTDQMLNSDILCGNYGINQSICKSSTSSIGDDFTGTPLSSSNISNPIETLLIVDSGYSMINWCHACDVPPVTLGNDPIEETAYVPGLCINDGRDLRPGQKKDAINGRHPNKTVNVGFVDGHVSRLKADDLLVEKIGTNNYKNISPLWVPKIK
jgi:prepilin-type processing-associated H-X9-DG protein